MKKLVLIALFGLTILISSAFAIIEIQGTIREITSDYWSETKKIGTNEYLSYRFQGVSTDTVNVTIEVVSGDSMILSDKSSNFLHKNPIPAIFQRNSKLFSKISQISS